MNIAITNVSLIPNPFISRNYVDENGNQLAGIMTNEAPLKSLIKRMSARGEKLDRIIYIESNAVRKEKEITGYGVYTHADFLRVRIAENVNGTLPQYDKEKDSIYIEDEPDELAVSKTIFAVYDRMLELYKEVQQSDDDKELNVYIEANGGVRYVLTMLLSIMRTLENSLEHFHIEEMSSMVAGHDKNVPIQIKNTKAIYDTSQITSIVEEYVNYGRINSLEKYARSLFAECDKEVKDDVELILHNLAKLAEDIQLCRTKMMLDDFYQGGGIGKKIDTFLDDYKDSDDASMVIFKHILEYIKEEYDKNIYMGQGQNQTRILYLPKVIKWCLEKDYIQQALTLSSERIPEYLFKSGKIGLSNQFQNQLRVVRDENYEESYYFLAHLKSDFLSIIDNAIINRSLQSIQDRDRNYKILSREEWESTKVNEKWELSRTGRYNAIEEVDNIYRLALAYKQLPENLIDKARIKRLILNNGFDERILTLEIRISSEYKSKLIDVFQGYFVDKQRIRKKHSNIETKEQRLIKSLPEIIKFYLSQRGIEEYKQIIDELFAKEQDIFRANLKKKYAELQSGKYYVRDAMCSPLRHIRTNLPGGADDLQLILYLFSMCKEQRNLSNHAHVSKGDRAVAMNAKQLKILINALLRACGMDTAR